VAAVQQRKPLQVELPREPGLRLGRVGLIAVVGFGIGLVWPHLAGVRLVPEVPTEKGETSAAELSGAPTTAGAAKASTAPGPPTPEPTPPSVSEEPFSVAPGEVTSCRASSGKRLERCDPVDFDAVARGRIATLSACEASKRAQGVLSLGFELDFAKDRVTAVLSGKSTTLPAEDAEELLACLRQNLGEISLAGMRHEHERYTVFYKVEFSSHLVPTTAGGPAASEVTPASGKATVAWDVALVRVSPTREGEVVARILQGTRLTVTGRHGDWYRVKYDTKGGEGWVFRTAIGM
jgi:hypothetical protein